MALTFPTACKPHREPLFPIQPMYPLTVNSPAFSSQHHVQPEIAEARTGLGQLAQPSLQDDIISAVVPVIPRGPIQSKQPTRTSHPDGMLP